MHMLIVYTYAYQYICIHISKYPNNGCEIAAIYIYNLSVLGTISESGTALSSKYAPISHTHDYAPSSHTHAYLPLSGGNLNGGPHTHTHTQTYI